MRYRLYSPADFPQLYAIEEICFQPPIRFSRRYMQELVDRSDSVTWIAEDNGTMAGFSIADIEKDPHGTVAYVQTIEVLPAYRNQGIGTELMHRLERFARSANAAAIWLHVESTNTSAIRLYRARGYQPQGTARHYYARGRNADIYAKPLTLIPNP